jgi:hypothetical protein
LPPSSATATMPLWRQRWVQQNRQRDQQRQERCERHLQHPLRVLCRCSIRIEPPPLLPFAPLVPAAACNGFARVAAVARGRPPACVHRSHTDTTLGQRVTCHAHSANVVITRRVLSSAFFIAGKEETALLPQSLSPHALLVSSLQRFPPPESMHRVFLPCHLLTAFALFEWPSCPRLVPLPASSNSPSPVSRLPLTCGPFTQNALLESTPCVFLPSQLLPAFARFEWPLCPRLVPLPAFSTSSSPVSRLPLTCGPFTQNSLLESTPCVFLPSQLLPAFVLFRMAVVPPSRANASIPHLAILRFTPPLDLRPLHTELSAGVNALRMHPLSLFPRFGTSRATASVAHLISSRLSLLHFLCVRCACLVCFSFPFVLPFSGSSNSWVVCSSILPADVVPVRYGLRPCILCGFRGVLFLVFTSVSPFLFDCLFRVHSPFQSDGTAARGV